MENYESLISEILEVDSLNPEDELDSFEAWDSLAVLTIIAVCDDNFGVVLSADEINSSNTIQGLKELINKKM